MNLLLAASDAGLTLRTLIIDLLIIAVLAAAASWGLRAVGEPVWASRVAGVIVGLGLILVLLSAL